jgi:hypothetical protein
LGVFTDLFPVIADIVDLVIWVKDTPATDGLEVVYIHPVADRLHKQTNNNENISRLN